MSRTGPLWLCLLLQVVLVVGAWSWIIPALSAPEDAVAAHVRVVAGWPASVSKEVALEQNRSFTDRYAEASARLYTRVWSGAVAQGALALLWLGAILWAGRGQTGGSAEPVAAPDRRA